MGRLFFLIGCFCFKGLYADEFNQEDNPDKIALYQAIVLRNVDALKVIYRNPDDFQYRWENELHLERRSFEWALKKEFFSERIAAYLFLDDSGPEIKINERDIIEAIGKNNLSFINYLFENEGKFNFDFRVKDITDREGNNLIMLAILNRNYHFIPCLAMHGVSLVAHNIKGVSVAMLCGSDVKANGYIRQNFETYCCKSCQTETVAGGCEIIDLQDVIPQHLTMEEETVGQSDKGLQTDITCFLYNGEVFSGSLTLRRIINGELIGLDLLHMDNSFWQASFEYGNTLLHYGVELLAASTTKRKSAINIKKPDNTVLITLAILGGANPEQENKGGVSPLGLLEAHKDDIEDRAWKYARTLMINNKKRAERKVSGD